MKYVPKAVTRAASRAALKLNANSPTILVVAGVLGFGATTALAIKATRSLEPVLNAHNETRELLELETATQDKKTHQKEIVRLYVNTGGDLARLYGPTIFLGTLSAASVLAGHQILKGRYVATMAAYSGLFEQFQLYRGRVRDALGNERELALFEGATLEYVEDPDHKGEYILKPKYAENEAASYLRPWFDEANKNWTRDATANYLFLKAVQSHMNRTLQVRGHVFLNDVFDQLGMERWPEGAVAGWIYGGEGDDYIDFGFMTSDDPQTVLFRNGGERSVRLNFNIDGLIWDKI